MEFNLSYKNIRDFNDVFNDMKDPEIYVSIDLSHNLLTELPQDLSMFSNLAILNILDNKFIDYEKLSLSLSTLPKLQELSLDLSTQETVIMILTALPNLIKLNGEKTNDTTLQQSILSKSGIANNNKPNSSINNLISNNVINNNINSTTIDNINNNINDNIKDSINDNINNNIDIDEESNDDNEKRDLSLNDETNIFEYICKNLNNDKFNKKFQNKLRNEISKINENLDIPNYLYNAHIIKSKLEIYTFIQDEITDMLLCEDNPNYKNISNAYINKIINNNLIAQILKIIREKIKTNQNLLFELAISFYDKKNSINNSSLNIKDSCNESDRINESKNNILNENKIDIYNINCFDINNNQNLSKNELLSLLNNIYQYNYEKKKITNESIVNSIDPFLLKKYGLKSIAFFWKKKILEGIEFYHKTDSEINLFKKIIENKIDESFYYNYIEIKRNCVSIIIQLIKEKNKNIKNEELENILNDKINNKYLEYSEWTKIINRLFDEKSEDYINTILYFIEEMNTKNNRYQEINNNSNNNIIFDDFLNELLNIQINLREKNNELITKIFNENDKDNDGYLNKKEFTNFIKSFSRFSSLNDNIIEQLLKNKINKNKISFSNCVEILFNELNFC